MKLAVTLLLLAALALALAPTRAQSAPRAPETAQIGGKEYARLNDGARANDFDARWLKRDETVQLTNRSAKLVLALESREAQMNGVEVWLLFPIVQRNGTVYVAKLDLQTTLQPIL